MPSRTANLAISLAAGLGTAALMQVSSPASAQACVQKPNIMFCGSTQRTGAALYSGAGPYTEVNGCAPNAATTQALLITRDGTIAGNGPAWLAYLNAGGQIITEWSITAAVYNAIYGTSYTNGAFFGNCADNAMPQVKLNPGNPFWLANNIPVTPAGEGACGFNLATLVAGEPTVTALGAVTAGEVMFARRTQGSGTLNLLEADWQDSQPNYTADSRTFMGVLISGCAAASGEPAMVPVNSSWLIAGLASLLALFGMSFVRRRRT